MRESVGEVPSLGLQQEKTKVAHFAMVTGRSDRKTFSLDTTCHFNLPACF